MKNGQIINASKTQVHIIVNEECADPVKEVKCGRVKMAEFEYVFVNKKEINLILIFSKNRMFSGIGVCGMTAS